MSAFLEIGDICAEVSYQITLKDSHPVFRKIDDETFEATTVQPGEPTMWNFLQKIVILKAKTRRGICFGSFREIMLVIVLCKICYMFVLSCPKSKFYLCVFIMLHTCLE